MGAVVLIDSISKSEVCLYEKNVKIRCTSGFSARQCRDRYIEGVKVTGSAETLGVKQTEKHIYRFKARTS